MIPANADIRTLLRLGLEKKASDLHLVTGIPPAFRVHGEILFADHEPMTPEMTRERILSILTPEQKEYLNQNLQLGFSFQEPGVAHYRVSVYYSRGNLEAAIRLRGLEIEPLKTLGLPEAVEDLTRLTSGLVLITGATGMGKTTTLNSMIDLINRERRLKIITVEDPIEYVHANKRSIVIQQEVRQDTLNFASALRHILRLDPDVICVGEMRDQETMATALTAAETGHLVIATLHTLDAARTVERIIDAFPGTEQNQVRAQLSNSLAGVISQVLLPRLDKKERVLGCEVLITSDAVRNSIREGKVTAIYNTIQSNHALGMQTMDQCLRDLYQRGLISYDVAAAEAKMPKMLREDGGRQAA